MSLLPRYYHTRAEVSRVRIHTHHDNLAAILGHSRHHLHHLGEQPKTVPEMQDDFVTDVRALNQLSNLLGGKWTVWVCAGCGHVEWFRNPMD